MSTIDKPLRKAWIMQSLLVASPQVIGVICCHAADRPSLGILPFDVVFED